MSLKEARLGREVRQHLRPRDTSPPDPPGRLALVRQVREQVRPVARDSARKAASLRRPQQAAHLRDRKQIGVAAGSAQVSRPQLAIRAARWYTPPLGQL